MIADGEAFGRVAQLRGRTAALARGGRYDLATCFEFAGELLRRAGHGSSLEETDPSSDSRDTGL